MNFVWFHDDDDMAQIFNTVFQLQYFLSKNGHFLQTHNFRSCAHTALLKKIILQSQSSQLLKLVCIAQ